MKITIRTGDLPLISSSCFFELDKNGIPLHHWELAEKVRKYNGDGNIVTQSEVVINGFRIRKMKGEIDLTIHHSWNGEIHNIEIDGKGGVVNWVEGFFDQTDKDFKTLFGF